jgi:hypothetical protein
VESFDERGLIRRGDSPRIKIGEKVVLGEELCWGCEKRVYAAEQVSGHIECTHHRADSQVFAVGHK